MKSCWKLGEVAGIGVFVHWSFLLVPAWAAFATLSGGGGLVSALAVILLIVAVFGCVLLHELGHALMARQYGIGTRDITLLPIGGIARLDRMPEQPCQELAVALAGPAVNVVIAASLLVGMMVAGSLAPLFAGSLIGGSLVVTLLYANIAMVLFNLLPAFPMDGGRVLRALLAMCLSRTRATEIAATIGQTIAVGLFFLGLFTNWLLAFVALFVFMAARSEIKLARIRSKHDTCPSSRQFQAPYSILPADARQIDVVAVLHLPNQDSFPVVRGCDVVGTVSKSDLLRELSAGGTQRRVEELTQGRDQIIRSADEGFYPKGSDVFGLQTPPRLSMSNSSPNGCPTT